MPPYSISYRIDRRRTIPKELGETQLAKHLEDLLDLTRKLVPSDEYATINNPTDSQEKRKDYASAISNVVELVLNPEMGLLTRCPFDGAELKPEKYLIVQGGHRQIGCPGGCTNSFDCVGGANTIFYQPYKDGTGRDWFCARDDSPIGTKIVRIMPGGAGDIDSPHLLDPNNPNGEVRLMEEPGCAKC